VISRRTLLALPLALSCSRKKSSGFSGYAFVANQEGKALAVLDLEAFAVAKHIALDDAPSDVLTAPGTSSVYALTPASGAVHEIQADRLSFVRKLQVAQSGSGQVLQAALDPEAKLLYVVSKEPRALTAVALDSLKQAWRLSLPGEPTGFSVTEDGKTAAISFQSEVRLVDLASRKLSPALGGSGVASVCFTRDGRSMIAADRANRRLSLYDVGSGVLITHLPVGISPDNYCFKRDGGEMFLTGEGMDAVVIVYPYHTPEVAETVLAGHAPGPMATSKSLLFIASPQSGDVSILTIDPPKVIGVVQVGSDPGFIAVTPDDQYALVLNRRSGDVAVLRVGGITANKYKSAALFTVIPVGSKPVSAAIRAVS
jgi:DNA-binding beta-propeller fold protein YncE